MDWSGLLAAALGFVSGGLVTPIITDRRARGAVVRQLQVDAYTEVMIHAEKCRRLADIARRPHPRPLRQHAEELGITDVEAISARIALLGDYRIEIVWSVLVSNTDTMFARAATAEAAGQTLHIDDEYILAVHRNVIAVHKECRVNVLGRRRGLPPRGLTRAARSSGKEGIIKWHRKRNRGQK